MMKMLPMEHLMITPPNNCDSIIGVSNYAITYDVCDSNDFSLDDGISDVFAVQDGR